MTAQLAKILALLFLFLTGWVATPSQANADEISSFAPGDATLSLAMTEHPPVTMPSPPQDSTQASMHVGGTTLETRQIVIGVLMVLAMLAIIL